jgi:chromosome partitioning protein
MAKIISFFNHKGGVGKTTSVHNIGYGLSKLGKKVLLIDADPQMNLTAAVYGLSIDSSYSNDDKATSKWKEYNKKYVSLYQIINAIITKQEFKPNFYTYVDKKNNEVNFDLLRGDILLHSLDADIMQIIQSNNEITRSYIIHLEEKLNEIYNNYDFVLIDQSPSAASALNAFFSLNASYVIIPATPTFFCLQAVNNLEDIWSHWNKLFASFKSTYNSDGFSMKSKFLGLIIQLGKRWKGGNAIHTEEWKEIINNGINGFVCNVQSNSVSKDYFVKIFNDSTPYIIATYDNFTDKLGRISEKKGIPFVALTKDDLPSEQSKKESDKQYLKSWESVQKTNQYICDSLVNLLIK